ncbi:MAG: hypothetical protein NC209_03930 [Alistipes sp.]|nr:hypothetical protein [Lachnospiraceae bacterium]MCM1250280.1 hypothetical protein [Alistipes sp.]
MTNSEKAKERVMEKLWESIDCSTFQKREELAKRMFFPQQPPKSDMERALELQKKYDELQADCKDLFSVIWNLVQGKEEPSMVEFNNPDGFPSLALDLIRHHATWSKEPKSK